MARQTFLDADVDRTGFTPGLCYRVLDGSMVFVDIVTGGFS